MSAEQIDQLLEQASRHYASGQLGPAEQCARQALELDSGDPDVLHLMGLISYAQGKVDPAIEFVRKAIDALPDEAEFHNNLGVLLRSKGDQDAADAAFGRAFELEPNNALAAYNLGMGEKAKGHPGQAETLFRQAIQANPQLAAAHFELGNIQAHRGNFDEALAHWQTAVQLEPKLGAAHLYIGYCLAQRGEFDPAQSALQKASELLGATDARPWWLLGNVALAQERPGDADRHFTKALAIDAKSLPAHLGLAHLHLLQGQAQAAADLATQAVSLWPQSPDGYDLLGTALQQLGRNAEAGTCFRSAKRLRTNASSEKLKFI